MRTVLKPDGRIAIIDYREKAGLITRLGHCTPESMILERMEAAGYRRTESYDFLRRQSYNVFMFESAQMVV